MIASVKAETTPGDSNPYAIISDRNVFHLNPPPPPPEPTPPKPPDLPPVKLSGFQKIGDHMKVYLAIPNKDPKETAYLSLQQGEKGNDVEIVAIRADKGEVDILNTGTPQTLNLLSNGFAISGGAPAAAPARANGGFPMPMHHMPGMPFPQPTAIVPPTMPVSTQGSAMVIGGSQASGGAGISGGASVSGGNSFVSGGAAPITAAAAAPQFGSSVGQVVPGGANNTSAQVANALFSGGQYHVPPSPNITPAPLDNQKAAILIQGAAGGPPVPPSIINEYNGGGGPPGPGQ
jgi:hypothetical protein